MVSASRDDPPSSETVIRLLDDEADITTRYGGGFIQSIDDNNARLNALLSGQIDAMAQLPTPQAKAHQSTGDITVLVAPSPQAMMFYMDTTQAPFTDVRVRQAIRLIADRKALVESAING